MSEIFLFVVVVEHVRKNCTQTLYAERKSRADWNIVLRAPHKNPAHAYELTYPSILRTIVLFVVSIIHFACSICERFIILYIYSYPLTALTKLYDV